MGHVTDDRPDGHVVGFEMGAAVTPATYQFALTVGTPTPGSTDTFGTVESSLVT